MSNIGKKFPGQLIESMSHRRSKFKANSYEVNEDENGYETSKFRRRVIRLRLKTETTISVQNKKKHTKK